MSRTKKSKPGRGTSQSQAAKQEPGAAAAAAGKAKPSAQKKKSKGPARAAKEKQQMLAKRAATKALRDTGFPKKWAELAWRKTKHGSIAQCWAWAIENGKTTKQPPPELLKEDLFAAPTITAKLDANVKLHQDKALAERNLSGTTARNVDLSEGKGEAALAKVGSGPHIGFLKLYQESKGFGFIACEKTQSAFGCDVFLHKNELGDIRDVGTTVNFNIKLNAKGHPQAIEVVQDESGAVLQGADAVHRQIRLTCPVCNYVLPKSDAFGGDGTCPRCVSNARSGGGGGDQQEQLVTKTSHIHL